MTLRDRSASAPDRRLLGCGVAAEAPTIQEGSASGAVTLEPGPCPHAFEVPGHDSVTGASTVD